MIEFQEDDYLECTCCGELIPEHKLKIIKAYKCETCGRLYKKRYLADDCCVPNNDDEDGQVPEVLG